MMLTGYLTVLEAASMIGESPTARGANIRALARAGKIPGAVKAGRDWLIPLAWAENRLVQKKERESLCLPKRGRPLEQPKTSAPGTRAEQLTRREIKEDSQKWEALKTAGVAGILTGNGIEEAGKECPRCSESLIFKDGHWLCKACRWSTLR